MKTDNIKPLSIDQVKDLRGKAVLLVDTVYNQPLYGTVNFEGVFSANYHLYKFEDYEKIWVAYELNLEIKEEKQ